MVQALDFHATNFGLSSASTYISSVVGHQDGNPCTLAPLLSTLKLQFYTLACLSSCKKELNPHYVGHNSKK